MFSGCSNTKYSFYGIIDNSDGSTVIKYVDIDETIKSEFDGYLSSYIILNNDGSFKWSTTKGEGDYYVETITCGTYVIDEDKLKLALSKEAKEKEVYYNLTMKNDSIVVFDGEYFIIFKK